MWQGDFNPGNYLLSADGQSLTLNFNTAVAGIGAAVQATAGLGNFTAQLQLFNAASALLGTCSVNSNNAGAEDGSDPFLGAQSSAVDIARAVFDDHGEHGQLRTRSGTGLLDGHANHGSDAGS